MPVSRRSWISCTLFGIAASGQTSAHSMQPVQVSKWNSGTASRNRPLSFEAEVPGGMKSPMPGSTGDSAMVPSRNGRATRSS